MAVKKVVVPDLGTLRLYKSKANRNIRLSVTSSGEIRVTMPFWVPYQTGISFARKKQDWIKQQITNHPASTFFVNNQAVGKAHHLIFSKTSDLKPRSRIKDSLITINYPEKLIEQDPKVQAMARSAVRRALKVEADSLLPQRLRALSEKLDLPFKGVSTKPLKSRWGSCNQDREITLNIYLLQLPWRLIDYVLIHELTHTKVLHHGPNFWKEFEQHLPEAKMIRREMRSVHPYGY